MLGIKVINVSKEGPRKLQVMRVLSEIDMYIYIYISQICLILFEYLWFIA